MARKVLKKLRSRIFQNSKKGNIKKVAALNFWYVSKSFYKLDFYIYKLTYIESIQTNLHVGEKRNTSKAYPTLVIRQIGHFLIPKQRNFCIYSDGS
jgi:hypothetical protein